MKKKLQTSPGARRDGSVLPFSPAPSASTAGYTLAESTHKRREELNPLPVDAPNILIVLLDDVGFGLSNAVGGEINTPTFARVAREGICYNTFHTTSICSPTRAALLTGRNHHRVHSGTIAERAVDWDGYTGVIGKDTATVAEVLHHYGYKTAAFGKWHNSPATQTTAMGPFDRWPTGHGFDYFYGFVAGETSQWEPRLYENINPVEPPIDEKYHLSEDLADKAVTWLRKHESFAPDKPFFMYWAPGAAHGPHHIFREWADKYKGKFDDGWDNYRERVFARQKATGWIPADAALTPRADTMQAWDDIPEEQRPFQRRLMEVFAGFLEHVDAQIGRILDELDRLGRSRKYPRNLYIRRQRFQCGGAERFDQRAAGAEQYSQHYRAAVGGSRQARRPRCARYAEDGQHVPRRLGMGRQHAVPSHQACGEPLRRHPESHGHCMAPPYSARWQNAESVPSCERHRPDDLRRPGNSPSRGGGRL